MRPTLTFILLLLNIGVFAYIYHLETGEDTDAAAERTGMLFGGDALRIERLSIRGQDAQGNPVERVLEQTPNGWMLTKPIRWPANPHAIQRILTELQFMESETSFSVESLNQRGRTLADYGLEDPAMSLLITGSGGEETTLKIGDATEIANRLYVLSPDGERVVVVSNELAESIAADLNVLRNPQVFDIPIFEIEALTIQIGSAGSDPASAGQQRVRIDKQGLQDWQISAPVSAPADADQVERMLSQLANVQADDFQREASPEMGLDSPRMRVTLWGNKRSQTLLIGNENQDGDFYARLDDATGPDSPVFTVAPGPFIMLRQAQVDLRERRFFPFDPENMHSVRIERPGQPTVSLQKLEDGTWQVIERGKEGTPTPNAADEEMIRKLLGELSRLEATRFVTDAPSTDDLEQFGFAEPAFRVTIGNGQEQTLLLGNRDENTAHIYAKRGDNPSVYEVRPHILVTLNPLPLDYREKHLYTLPQAARIRSIKITNTQTGQTLFNQAIDPDKQTWEDILAQAKLDEEQRTAAADLIRQLRSLRVHSYLSDTFSDNYKLYDRVPITWRYKLEAEIFLPGGGQPTTRTETLLLSERLAGAAIGNAQIGGSPGANMIFSLTQEMIDALFPLTNQRTPPPEPQNLEPPNETGTATAEAPEPETPAKEQAKPAEKSSPATDKKPAQ